MSQLAFPPWVVLHIPHDSTHVPDEVRPQFVLSDDELKLELQRMTDHYTYDIFTGTLGEATVVRAPVSRLVVDVERFIDDVHEPMAARGMGAVYQVTSHLAPLRRMLLPEERETLLRDWYIPHHERLETAVTDAVNRYGRCLVIDGHSFPGTALPYEAADPSDIRSDICIGSDPFHTPRELEQDFASAFERAGWRVAVNDPFSGVLVPASRYRKDVRVTAVMVEINRDLYLDPCSFERKPEFDEIAEAIRACCHEAIG